MRTLLLISFISIGLCAYGQEKYQKEVPNIEVLGHATKEFVPDEIYVRITLLEQDNNREQITIESQYKTLLNSLSKIGLSEKNIEMSDSRVDYYRIKWFKKDAVISSSCIVTLNSAKQTLDLFEELDKINIHMADIIGVSHSKIEEFSKEVKIQAIKNAKEKADYLLNAIGSQTGTPLKVKEIDELPIANGISFRGSRVSSNVTYIDGEEVAAMNSVDFKKIKIESKVYVMFSIVD